MTEDELLSECKTDLNINRADIAGEGIRIPNLITKYGFILLREKRVLRRLEDGLALVKKSLFEFYRNGPTKESKTKWADAQKAPQGAISKKAELEIYIEADEVYIVEARKVADQKDIIALLDEMMTHLRQRNFVLQNITKQTIFEAGGP